MMEIIRHSFPQWCSYEVCGHCRNILCKSGCPFSLFSKTGISCDSQRPFNLIVLSLIHTFEIKLEEHLLTENNIFTTCIVACHAIMLINDKKHKARSWKLVNVGARNERPNVATKIKLL